MYATNPARSHSGERRLLVNRLERIQSRFTHWLIDEQVTHESLAEALGAGQHRGRESRFREASTMRRVLIVGLVAAAAWVPQAHAQEPTIVPNGIDLDSARHLHEWTTAEMWRALRVSRDVIAGMEGWLYVMREDDTLRVVESLNRNGGPGNISARVSGPKAFGDLNGDGLEDVALVASSRGSMADRVGLLVFVGDGDALRALPPVVLNRDSNVTLEHRTPETEPHFSVWRLTIEDGVLVPGSIVVTVHTTGGVNERIFSYRDGELIEIPNSPVSIPEWEIPDLSPALPILRTEP